MNQSAIIGTSRASSRPFTSGNTMSHTNKQSLNMSVLSSYDGNATTLFAAKNLEQTNESSFLNSFYNKRMAYIKGYATLKDRYQGTLV